jgi:hypothetical protein
MAWLFMGGFGLTVGVVLVAIWWLIEPSQSALWKLSIALTVTGMLLLLAQGLPRSPVVGAQFGVDHLLAHRVVGTALAVAAFAAIVELMGLQADRGTRPLGWLVRRGQRVTTTDEPEEPDISPT